MMTPAELSKAGSDLGKGAGGYVAAGRRAKAENEIQAFNEAVAAKMNAGELVDPLTYQSNLLQILRNHGGTPDRMFAFMAETQRQLYTDALQQGRAKKTRDAMAGAFRSYAPEVATPPGMESLPESVSPDPQAYQGFLQQQAQASKMPELLATVAEAGGDAGSFLKPLRDLAAEDRARTDSYLKTQGFDAQLRDQERRYALELKKQGLSEAEAARKASQWADEMTFKREQLAERRTANASRTAAMDRRTNAMGAKTAGSQVKAKIAANTTQINTLLKLYDPKSGGNQAIPFIGGSFEEASANLQAFNAGVNTDNGWTRLLKAAQGGDREANMHLDQVRSLIQQNNDLLAGWGGETRTPTWEDLNAPDVLMFDINGGPVE